MKMKKTIAKTILAALLVCAAAAPAAADILRGHHRGELMPAFTLPILATGQRFAFDPGGQIRPTAIFFFSINPKFRRGRALALLSELAAMSARFRGRADILAIYEDKRDADTVRRFIETLPEKPQVLTDGKNEVYDRYGVFMMPIVVILAPGGKLHEVIPYTYGIKRIIEANLLFLVGDISRDELKKRLAPRKNRNLSPEERQFVRRLNYARVLERKKLYEQALREYQKAARLAPKRAEGFVGMGFMNLELKRYKEAAENFSHARRLDPDSDDAVAGQGLLLYRTGDHEKALPLLENAFITPEPRLEVMLALAAIYEEKKEMDKAVRMNKLVVQKLLTMLNQRWR